MEYVYITMYIHILAYDKVQSLNNNFAIFEVILQLSWPNNWPKFIFKPLFDGTDSYELTGLGRGGEQIAKVKKVYEEVVRLLIEIAR